MVMCRWKTKCPCSGWSFLLWLGVIHCVVWFPLSLVIAEEVEPAFNRDILPILSGNCFACHGRDAHARKADLRLDLEQAAKAERDGEAAILPGEPERSALYRRISSKKASFVMPPPESNKSLTPDEIKLIALWIEAGAPWEDHWSFTPVTRPALPGVAQTQWPANPVDDFILERLEREGLRPSPAENKITLLRRVTFDLTGLPPSLEEMDAFLADVSPQAFERVVDRLLASTRYGEHMGRYWLDAVRYGDTHGLHLDNYREIWPYRDWVIRAFNENKPFDAFVIEQLAGDLLPDPSRDQLIATGHNRCNVTTNEGGSITEEVYVRNVVDRVVTLGTVYMGLTLDCTRCHDHKFDPLTMDDFYSLFAYFNSIDGKPLDGNRKDHAPILKIPDAHQAEQLAEYDARVGQLTKRMREPWPTIDALQETWEADLVRKEQAEESGGDAQKEDGSLVLGDWYVVGPFYDNRRYLNSRKHGPEGRPVRLDETFTLATEEIVRWKKRPDWKDGKVHSDLPGQTAANFLYRTITSPQAQKVEVSLGSDDGIIVYLNEKRVLSNNVSRGVAPDQEKLQLPLKAGTNHLLMKIMNYGGATGFYFALTSGETAIPEDVLAIAMADRAQRDPEAQAKLVEFFRSKVAVSDELEAVRSELTSVREKRAEVDRGIPTTLIWREATEQKPAYKLNRGEYDQKGDEVARRTPVFLAAMDANAPNDRLGLARWLVDPNHPLTARVTVNRLWQQLMGTGLVKTAEDFGSQGERPSHPQLLDWLAAEFMAGGWDVKAMMKLLVTSSTYRQSSVLSPALIERDPDNRLLARGPRFRLDAEMLRDQALCLSGLMSEKMGGPSVKPPQPDGLWFSVGYSGSNTVRFVADKEHDQVHRRSVYTFIKRTSPPPQMSTFDGPSREASCVRRERTNTPLQALLLFNDPQYVEAARALAERVLASGGDTVGARAGYLFRLCTGRFPDSEELADLISGLEQDLTTFRADPASAAALVGGDASASETDTDAGELAAWTMSANLMLNLDEVIMKN